MLRLARKARRQHLDHLRRENERQRQQYDLRREQQREDTVAEAAGRFRAALGANARIGRNEGGIECALGENGAEMIRQPESDEESIGDRPGADDGRKHDVTQKACQPRQKRVAANGENLPDHCRP